MATLIKKISIKTVCGKPEREVIGQDANGKPVIGFVEKELMQVVGIASSTRTGTTTYGDYVGFRGQFQATNMETGEQYRAAQCFLPDDITSMLAVELGGDNVKKVEFAFVVGIRPRDDLEIGYEYPAKPLMEPSSQDPLESLINRTVQKLETKVTPINKLTQTETKTDNNAGEKSAKTAKK